MKSLKNAWMSYQGMGGSSLGWLHNRGKSAINDWDISRRDQMPAKEIGKSFLFCLRTGCADEKSM
jgi:hypothetical protein